MQSGSDSSAGKPASADQDDGLLHCRMSMLGLDPQSLENRELLDDIMRRCKCCEFREACAVDLERDPNNPVWEAYCPNTGTFHTLTQALWRTD
jgi:hypothetical protein